MLKLTIQDLTNKLESKNESYEADIFTLKQTTEALKNELNQMKLEISKSKSGQTDNEYRFDTGFRNIINTVEANWRVYNLGKKFSAPVKVSFSISLERGRNIWGMTLGISKQKMQSKDSSLSGNPETFAFILGKGSKINGSSTEKVYGKSWNGETKVSLVVSLKGELSFELNENNLGVAHEIKGEFYVYVELIWRGSVKIEKIID
jgi:hypothetical protein